MKKQYKLLESVPKIRLIYSATKKRIIGRNGKLAAYIPPDIERFKELTTHSVVLYGLNTYFSLPGKSRPLKDRTNLVLTTNSSLKLPNVIIYQSMNSAISDYSDKDIWIIGGGKVLKQAIHVADEIYLTLIHNDLPGDCLSPIIDDSIWQLVSESEVLMFNNISYQYLIYRRRIDVRSTT